MPDKPFIDVRHFPFLAEFESKWQIMRDEVREILKHSDDNPGFERVSPDQYRLARERHWKTYVFYGFGQQLPQNCHQAPVTTEVLSRVPHVQTAWFSILAPGFYIPTHTGVTKGTVRAHLGLIIPKEREKCRFRVADKIRA